MSMICNWLRSIAGEFLQKLTSMVNKNIMEPWLRNKRCFTME
jgi:hypothetical protein